ncbi:MAG: transporter [Fibrobacteres bacterium]|nr:transporter [Fibrobacterota bacterium]
MERNAIPAGKGRFDGKTSRSLILFGFAMFVQTTSALSIVGILGPVAAEWRITPTAAALLVTAFGATFALSAPLLQMLVGHWIRRTQILTGLLVMALGAVVFALAPGYGLLFSARLVMGLGAALLSPVLLALGSSLVEPQRQGGALAIVSMGISIATVVGVPASAWLGEHLGPRLLYAGLAAVLVATAVLIARLVPDRSRGERVGPRQALRLLGRPSTLSGLSVIFFITAGIFATYTMITPILRDTYGAGTRTVSLALLLYGVSGLVGNLFVRSASARRSSETLLKGSMLVLIAIFSALLVLPISMAFLLAALVAWPFVSDIVWPSQQRRMVELEPAFRGIALALSSSFLFSGMAFGSALGGIAYAAQGYVADLILSIGLFALGLGALAYSVSARRRNSDREIAASLPATRAPALTRAA